jgi:hypothetical protein
MARSNRSLLRRLPGCALLGTGLFLLLEVSARVYLFGFAGLVPALINSERGLPQTGYTRPAPAGSGRVFEMKPNLDGYFKFVPFRTNSQGLRDQEYSLEKPEGTFRVAVLGASFALPAGVAIEDAFHSLLEERLSEEFAPTRYEFINFAVGMYNPGQVLAMLEQRALAYDPDLILVTATRLSTPWLVKGAAASIAEARRERPPEAADAFRMSYPILKSYFYLLLLQRSGHAPEPGRLQLGILERLFMRLMERGAPSRGPAPGGAPEPAREALPTGARSETDPDEKSIIVRLAAIGRRVGVPVVLVRLEFDPSEKLPIALEAEDLARANGVYYLDTRDAFAGTHPSDFWIHELDPHPNREAHAIFARRISDFLHAEGLLTR